MRLGVEQAVAQRPGRRTLARIQQRDDGQGVVVDERDVAQPGVVLVALRQPRARGAVRVRHPLEEPDRRSAGLPVPARRQPAGRGLGGRRPEGGEPDPEGGAAADQQAPTHRPENEVGTVGDGRGVVRAVVGHDELVPPVRARPRWERSQTATVGPPRPGVNAPSQTARPTHRSMQRTICKSLFAVYDGLMEPAITVTGANLKALTHPLRVQVLGLLRTYGPATATTLAQRLGLTSGALSYHLRQLERYGFIAEDTERGNERDRWWRAVHRTTEFDAQGLDPAAAEAGRRVRAGHHHRDHPFAEPGAGRPGGLAGRVAEGLQPVRRAARADPGGGRAAGAATCWPCSTPIRSWTPSVDHAPAPGR